MELDEIALDPTAQVGLSKVSGLHGIAEEPLYHLLDAITITIGL